MVFTDADVIALGTAVASIITATGTAIAQITKARQDRKVAGAVSQDLTTIADSTDAVDSGDLVTPRLVSPNNDTPASPNSNGTGPPPPPAR